MQQIKLEATEVDLAMYVAQRRYIGNLKMGKTFSYGYTGNFEKTINDGLLGVLGEMAFAKFKDKYFNGSYSDEYSRYTGSDFKGDIEIRSQKKKEHNFLLIRPGEKHGRYVLVIHEGDYLFTIAGWYPFYNPMPERLTNFGYAHRPAAYKVELNELYDINEL